jgi:hypothetical protein
MFEIKRFDITPTLESLKEIDNFLESKNVEKLKSLFRFTTPKVELSTKALEVKDYNFTKIIFNEGENQDLINYIKNVEDGLFKSIGKYKRLLESTGLVDIELKMKYKILQNLERNAKVIRIIKQIKFFDSKNIPDQVAKLSDELTNVYNEIYGEMSEGSINQNLNQSQMLEIFDKCKDTNPKFWDTIKSKIEPRLNQRIKNEILDISEFKKFDEQFIAQKLDKFCPEALLAFENPDEIVTADFMKEQCEIALQKIYAQLDPKPEKIWSCRITTEDPNNKTFIAAPSTNEILVPPIGRKISSFKSVLYHEVLIHALRHINAKSKGLPPSLPGFLNFEEGLANTVQFLREEGKTKIASNTYIPNLVSLVKAGLQIDEIVKLYDYENMSEKKKNTFNINITRILRGSTGIMNEKRTANIYHKDLAYSIGMKKIYKFVSALNDETLNPELKNAIAQMISELVSCKFDPFNIDHVRFLLSKKILNFNKRQELEYSKFIASE